MCSAVVEKLTRLLKEDTITGFTSEEGADISALNPDEVTELASYRSDSGFTIMDRFVATTGRFHEAFFLRFVELLKSMLPSLHLRTGSIRLTRALVMNTDYSYIDKLLFSILKLEPESIETAESIFLDKGAVRDILKENENLAQKAWRCQILRLTATAKEEELLGQWRLTTEELRKTQEENRCLRAENARLRREVLLSRPIDRVCSESSLPQVTGYELITTSFERLAKMGISRPDTPLVSPGARANGGLSTSTQTAAQLMPPPPPRAPRQRKEHTVPSAPFALTSNVEGFFDTNATRKRSLDEPSCGQKYPRHHEEQHTAVPTVGNQETLPTPTL